MRLLSFVFFAFAILVGVGAAYFYSQGWKFMSCSHCQGLGQQTSWLLIGCTRVNNQIEARSAS